MSKISNALQHISAVLSIAGFGGITMSGIIASGAGIWAVLERYTPLGISLVLLFVFAAVLWSFIGIIWLKDRAERTRLKPETADPYSWGIVLFNFVLIRDHSNPEAEWQLRAELKSKVGTAIRIKLEEFSSVINSIIPDRKLMEYDTSVVIPKEDGISINSAPYKAGMLPGRQKMIGKITIKILYGHPDIGYSRSMEKEFGFTCVLSDPDQPSGVFIPLVGIMSESDSAISPIRSLTA